jgi:hypothetical protein
MTISKERRDLHSIIIGSASSRTAMDAVVTSEVRDSRSWQSLASIRGEQDAIEVRARAHLACADNSSA